MIRQVQGKIFLAEERGLNETEGFASFNTFNFGNYFSEHKKPVGDIYVLNDDVLEGGSSLRMLVEEPSYIIVLPVIGAVKYEDSLGNHSMLAAGQVQVSVAEKGTTMKFTNPFPGYAVNFLEIWIRKPDRKENSSLFNTHTFENVSEYPDTMLPLYKSSQGDHDLKHSFTVGKFSGRGETLLKPQKEKGDFFIFVLEGAFEVEGRLLHRRDALVLYNAEEAEAEALSNDALLLVVELPAASSGL
jgi:redox-sensitive bicupin YhaK (pirin superfamily)